MRKPSSKTQRMGMMTDGHWWSDRVEQPSDILQRERLGGIALVRGQYWPGNLVSWRFAEAGAAENVALLVGNDAPGHFRVTAYNTSDHVQKAIMSTWDIPAGEWEMRVGQGAPQHLILERSAGVPVEFAAHGETVLDLRLVKAGDPVDQRPDLGIGRDDVTVAKGRVGSRCTALARWRPRAELWRCWARMGRFWRRSLWRRWPRRSICCPGRRWCASTCGLIWRARALLSAWPCPVTRRR
jgi:hypothetical protein